MASYEQIIVDSEKPGPNEAPVHRSKVGQTLWLAITWRFVLVVLFAISLVVVLYMYQQKGSLSSDERRLFNALTLLFTALISLSVGSLLGLLGSMIRWPLLATWDHSPQHVDLVLGMAEATGALRLLWFYSVTSKKWTITTLAALLYLIVNTLGRLSVASIGLAFDVNESVDLKLPIKVTDWGSSKWFDVQRSSIYGRESDFPSQYFRLAVSKMQEFASLGQLLLGNETNVKINRLNGFDEIALDKTDAGVPGFNFRVEEETVTYSYLLREHQGTEEVPSRTKALESSSRCLAKGIVDGKVYEWGKPPVTLENRTEASPDFVQAVYRFNISVERFVNGFVVDSDAMWFSRLNWTALANSTIDCATSFIVYRPACEESTIDTNDTVVYECNTCLTGINHLHGLPAENVSYVGNLLLYHSSLNDGLYWPVPNSNRSESYVAQVYQDPNPAAGGVRNAVSFLDDLNLMPSTDELYRAMLSQDAPGNEDGLAAARTPLLPLVGAERLVPIVNEVPGQEVESIVIIELEVKWDGVYLILGCIVGGSLLAVLGVIFACKGVPMQDPHSHVTVSCLLRNAVAVADYAGWSRMMLRYGAKIVEGKYEVGLWVVEIGNQVVDGFPEGEYRPDLWTGSSGVELEASRRENRRIRTRRLGDDGLRSPDPMMGSTIR